MERIICRNGNHQENQESQQVNQILNHNKILLKKAQVKKWNNQNLIKNHQEKKVIKNKEVHKKVKDLKVKQNKQQIKNKLWKKKIN